MKVGPITVRIEPAWNPALRLWWAGLAISTRISLIASLVLAAVLLLDRPILDFGRSLDPSARALMRRITLLGDSSWSLVAALALITLAAVIAQRTCRRGRVRLRVIRRAATYVFASVAISGIIASLSKNMIGRARPSALNPPEVLAFDPMLFRAAYASFPSGHATTCVALAVSLGVIWPRHRTAFLIVGTWGALSRTLIGAHWFSDVVAGGILGAVVALWLRDRLWRRTV